MTGRNRSIDHFGLTVPDLDDACAFFAKAFGYAEVYRLGPPQVSDDWMRINLNVPEGTRLEGIAMLRADSGALLELFQYRAESRKAEPPCNADIGGNHVAFYVDDIDAAVAHLRGLGVRMNGDVKLVSDGPLEGLRWVYFLSSWGQQLELVSYPDGLGYARDADRPARRSGFDDGDPA